MQAGMAPSKAEESDGRVSALPCDWQTVMSVDAREFNGMVERNRAFTKPVSSGLRTTLRCERL